MKNGGGFTAFDLQRMDFPPLQWVVPGYVPEGLSMVVGKPKIGKSWMVLDWALAIAYGGVAFGSVRCDQGDVLYCALEDNKRRLQRRMSRLLPVNDWPDRLELRIMPFPRINAGGLEEMRKWANGSERPRLIVVDTFKQIKPPKQRQDATYDHDYDAMAPLQELAGELGIAIVVVHHASKREISDDPLDMVSGTTGVTGAADTILLLHRDTNGTTLFGRGRDLEYDIEEAVKFVHDTARWSLMGNAEDARRSDSRKAIITALRGSGEAMGPNSVADEAGISRDVCKHLLRKMVASGDIEKVGTGKYQAK